MANKINSIRSNRQNALQIVGTALPDDQLITVTVTVVDSKTAEVQEGVPVWWGYQGVNRGIFQFYNTADKSVFHTTTDHTTTGADGTTSIYVGSQRMCIGNVTASLTETTEEDVRPEILGTKKTIPSEKGVSVGTTIAIWTVGAGGDLPLPQITEENLVTIPTWVGGDAPAASTPGTALLGPNYSLEQDAPYIAWLGQGSDTTVLGEVLTIGTYNGQSITVDVPYMDIQTGPQSVNNIAYMIYSGRQGAPSQIYTFSATGTALQRPDDIRHPPDGNLKQVLYEYGDGSLDIPPTMLTYDDFDPGSKTMTWAIPDYNDPNGELRVKTDKIVVTGYGDAWHHNSTSPHFTSLELTELTGDDFTNGYAYFTMNLSDWQDYCHNVDSNLYGRIWIQYVVNEEHYSQSMTTLINFCQD